MAERIYITKLENGLRGLRLGTKTPDQIDFKKWHDKLKKVNPALAEDYYEKYSNNIIKVNRKHNKDYSQYF